MKRYILSVFPAFFLLSCQSPPATETREVDRMDLPRFSTEGTSENLRVTFEEPVKKPVTLRVYRFHYPMHRDIAPEPDTWVHRKQMKHMEKVKVGKTSPFVPEADDPRMKEVLDVSSKFELSLDPGPNRKTYSTSWNARHGRIFFRLQIGERTLPEIHTTRVHCNRINMVSVERLKTLLGMIRIPLQKEHGEMAKNMFTKIQNTYRKGHGLEFMLAHHEIERQDLEQQFQQLSSALNEERFQKARSTIDGLLESIREKERHFYDVRIDRNRHSRRISISLTDRMNDRSFGEYPDADVYVKEHAPVTERPDAMKRIHGTVNKGTHENMNQHQKHVNSRYDRLTRNAVRLSEGTRKNEFRKWIPDEWGRVKIIVLYGPNHNYYLTQIL